MDGKTFIKPNTSKARSLHWKFPSITLNDSVGKASVESRKVASPDSEYCSAEKDT